MWIVLAMSAWVSWLFSNSPCIHRWTPKIDQWSVTDGFATKLQPPFNIHVEKCSEKVDISTLPLHFLHCLFLQIDSEKQFRGSNSVDPQNKEFAFSRNFPKMSHLPLSSGKLSNILKNLCISKGLFINDVIILGGYPRVLLQTNHVLRVYNVLSIHGWSERKPAKNDDVIYEQPLMKASRLVLYSAVASEK